VAVSNDLSGWFTDVRARMLAAKATHLGEIVVRGAARDVFPKAGEEDLLDEPIVDMDFSDWPLEARLMLEHEIQLRNMEHIWHGARLVVPTRLESSVDDLLDELLEQGAPAPPDSSTRWCPSCEGEFVAGIDTCPDCGVPLVDAKPQAGFMPSIPTTRIDLSRWSEESRFLLAHQIAGGWPLFDAAAGASLGGPVYPRPLPANLPHAWDGTTLVVPETQAGVVEAWVAGHETAVELALDPEADKLAYDVEDMSDETLTLLLEALLSAEIPHELSDDGELFVHESDEAAVEQILDRVDYPDELPAQEDDELEDRDDGLEVQEVLSDVFESADRLTHDTRNPDAMLALAEGVDRMAQLDVPFGFHRDQWDALVEQAATLRTSVEVEEPDQDAVAEQASALRDALRSIV
jgi:hypothetical protein